MLWYKLLLIFRLYLEILHFLVFCRTAAVRHVPDDPNELAVTPSSGDDGGGSYAAAQVHDFE